MHPAGYFSKKVRGKVHYLGRWDEGPEVAEQRWEARKDDWLNGREAKVDQEASVAGFTVRDLLDEFRNFKRRQQEQGRGRRTRSRAALEVNGGRSFYTLRATCRPEAGRCFDQQAVFYTMRVRSAILAASARRGPGCRLGGTAGARSRNRNRAGPARESLPRKAGAVQAGCGAGRMQSRRAAVRLN